MIKFRLIDRRTTVSKRIQALKDQLEELPKEFMRKTADEIVYNSPVDTGTYMDAHSIGATTSSTSSKNKPRNQPWQDHAQRTLDRLYAQIEALPPEETKHFISNNSDHAWKVEYEHGYAPYTTARAKAEFILQDAIRKVMK